MKLNPMVFFNLFLLLFALADIFLIYFLYSQGNRNYLVLGGMALVALFLFFIMYSLNFGISLSEKKVDEVEKDKNHLSYTTSEFIIDHPLTQRKEIVKWKTVEAVFLNNRPPLEGEYHNFEYAIVLNSNPIEEKYQNQSWYNKLFPDSNKNENKLPIIYIRDDSNADFYSFKDALAKNLNINENYLSQVLDMKFGNKTETIKTGDTFIEKPVNEILKTVGFYTIFDRGNSFEDTALKKFREESEN